MLLPEALLTAIDRLAGSIDRQKLHKSAEDLSFRYRHAPISNEPLIKAEEECVAYLCTRFPATYAANHYVLSEVKRRILGNSIHSILDLGAGSGAALWAAMEVFEGLSSYTLLERDLRLIKIGKHLLEDILPPCNIQWLCKDYTDKSLEHSYDLSLFSYSLGELDPKKWETTLEQVVDKTNQLLVIIEPGTPVGYQKIMTMRDILIRRGLHTVAPCPHNKRCPMLKPDWCHFSQRLPRSSLHRILKKGSLGFEDEKFSYIIMSKQPYAEQGSRVIKTPLKRSGYIELELCSADEELLHKKISKKQNTLFKEAKKLEWGSFYPETQNNS